MTTLLPAPSAARMSAFAGSCPPISSTTRSTSGAVATEARSVVQRTSPSAGVARFCAAARPDGDEAETDAAALREVRRALREEPRERAPDVAEAEESHADGRRTIAFHARAMYGTATPRSKRRLRRHPC